MELLTTKNLKTMKGEKLGYFTGILHLAPYDTSGKNVCPNATEGCSSSCLNTSGHGRYQRTQRARIRRTLEFLNERKKFLAKLEKDIETVIRRSKKNGVTPAFRLNGTSDIPKLSILFAEKFAKQQFYDYTKNFKTLLLDLPENYHLTFSRSEKNEKECKKALQLGYNVAVVFEKMPETYWGYEVVSGEESDLRFLDKKGVIIGLTPKGKARRDKTGFVVRPL